MQGTAIALGTCAAVGLSLGWVMAEMLNGKK